MGYDISQNSASFKMKGSNLFKAMVAIKMAVTNKKIRCYGEESRILSADNLKDMLKRFGWILKFEKPVNTAPALTIDDVSKILSKLLTDSREGSADKEFVESTIEGILSKMPQDLGVEDISFEGECLSDEDNLFNFLAPYVEAGSYIEMSGGDGDIWRWVFDGTKCEQKKPKKVEW